MTRRKTWLWGLVIGLMVLVAGVSLAYLRIIRHDLRQASRVATEFGYAAFVTGHADVAYRMMSKQVTDQVGLEQFSLVLKQMHPRMRPDYAEAVMYEPIPGQGMVYIYLVVTTYGDNFSYRILLAGDADYGYRVLGVVRPRKAYDLSGNRRSLRAVREGQ